MCGIGTWTGGYKGYSELPIFSTFGAWTIFGAVRITGIAFPLFITHAQIPFGLEDTASKDG